MSEPTPAESLRPAVSGALLLGVVAVSIGGYVILAGAVFNEFPRFRPYFLALGTAGFFAPGVVALAAGWLMRDGQPAGGRLGVAAGLWLAAVGLAGVGAQAVLRPVSLVPVLLCALLLAAGLALAWQARAAAKHLRAAGGGPRGFEVRA